MVNCRKAHYRQRAPCFVSNQIGNETIQGRAVQLETGHLRSAYEQIKRYKNVSIVQNSSTTPTVLDAPVTSP